MTDDVFGDYGLSGGGAAGFELDRADPTAGHAARRDHAGRARRTMPGSYVVVPEELLTHDTT